MKVTFHNYYHNPKTGMIEGTEHSHESLYDADEERLANYDLDYCFTNEINFNTSSKEVIKAEIFYLNDK